MGMVFQNFELFAHLTALENITLAPMRAKGLGLEVATAIARELLEKVRIPEKADHYPDELWAVSNNGSRSQKPA